MHLRRALLLFAIVLGTAALVASLSRPVDEPSEREPASEPRRPTAEPTPAPELRKPVSFDAAMDESERLRAGRAATVEVAVMEPGSVEIPGLGLSAAADPLTPARFEVLPSRPGDYDIVFTPASGEDTKPAGRLVVTSAG